MKRIYFFYCVALFAITGYLSAGDFDSWFENRTMRVDIVHSGDSHQESVALWQIKAEPYQPFNENTLTESLGLGHYRYQVFDLLSNQLLFNGEYSSLFGEFIYTTESNAGLNRAFQETLRFPYPKNKVRLILSSRDRQNQYHEIFYLDIDPKDAFILQDVNYSDVKVHELKINGKPGDKVDILFMGEGYTATDLNKFLKDANRYMNVMLAKSPYSDFKDAFNFRALMPASLDIGPDEPEKGLFRDSFFDASFNTFYIARYLTLNQYWRLCDVAANAPYEVFIVLVNTTRYGGGGIYNYYNVVTSDNALSETVLLHEFGHGFAALGDEYETETYDGIYDLAFDPWEPNLTIYTEKDKIKWGDLIAKDTPLPTPPDSMYLGIVGAFEGGGYQAKGIYRPQLDCMMHSNKADYYCAVCRNAIIRVLNHYIQSAKPK